MTNQQHKELVELLEDTLEYFCDQNIVSGEEAWLTVQNLAVVKQQINKGRLWNLE